MEKLKSKHSINTNMSKILRDTYNFFNLRFNVNEARKLLNLDKSVPKAEVNAMLKDAYKEMNPTGYVYTIKGKSYQLIPIYKKKKIVGYKKGKPETITLQFYKEGKKVNYKLREQVSIPIGVDADEKLSLANYKIVSYIDITDTDYYLKAPENAKQDFLAKGTGSERIIDIEELTVSSQTRKFNQNIKTSLMFKAFAYLPYKEFNGFKDLGNGMCVPETILHHIQLNNRNKKQTLDKVIDVLESIELNDVIEELESNEPDKCEVVQQFRYTEDEIDEYEDPETYIRGKSGYTPYQLIKTLEYFGVRGKILDINQKEFIKTNNFDNGKIDRHTKSFLGICYANHLYYCHDSNFITSFNNKKENSNLFDNDIYEKTTKKKLEKTIEYHNTEDLTEHYKTNFIEDNTFRLVKVYNGKIVEIVYDDKIVKANINYDDMVRLFKDTEYHKYNFTSLGKKLFDETFTEHKQSSFTKAVFDEMTKHGNIVKNINKPVDKVGMEYDINKCYTDCMINNRLGNYCVFCPNDSVELFDGNIKTGIYWVETEDTSLFMRGNSWYTGGFCKYAKQKNIKFNIKYQLIPTNDLPSDYFKDFVNNLVKDYPNDYKKIVNMLNGNFGKTDVRTKEGYIEPNFDLACSAFWDNNEDKIGFTYDENIDKKKWKLMKGKFCNVDALYINGQKQYIVETTTFKTMYENDLPIYNQVLENSYIRLYELINKVGGNLIKIKTDAIVVDGNYNKIKCNPDIIGGYKCNKIFTEDIKICMHHLELDKNKEIDTGIKWNIKYEQQDGSFETFDKSFLITGMAGYGKSYIMRNLPHFEDEDSIRLGFTNISKENLNDDRDLAVNTLNTYFSINYNTKKVSEKQIKKLKRVKRIFITEAFMTPSYIMNMLSKIKATYPDIIFICEGDPEQNRPVMEEEIDWLNTKLFNELCDGNMLKLTINKRNNETENYNKILQGEALPKDKFSDRKPRRINIVRTNKMRVKINDMLMDKVNYDYYIKSNEEHDKVQDMYLKLDTPIMCIKNNKKLNIKNGKMYDIQGFNENSILINDVEYDDKTFINNFVVAYAMTNHKIQGLTIKEPFNIYEWSSMSRRERYTAYSRTSDGNNVKIIID